MKRLIVLLPLLLLVVACGPSFDEEGFEKVNNYADEMIPLVEETNFELIAQIENEQLNESAEEYADKIKSINDNYWKDGSIAGISEEELEEWQIKMSRGNMEWDIQGEDLADTLYELNADSDYLANAINDVIEESTEETEERLIRAIESSQNSAEQLRKVIYNK
ncbi:hypothetical protein G4V62_13790 [Bacillaceae bacterium SIJ1]|uniref:hypothetical protein n=1 Tax=Litoribacterium kuwaitense TaxID=1398745 RepID=UPI0013EB9DB4|nr:hypothetical protein [Litoribacterium kuwaitense]NGP45966.1 hypothetical protein [Litoribacterium kuwaitense]